MRFFLIFKLVAVPLLPLNQQLGSERLAEKRDKLIQARPSKAAMLIAIPENSFNFSQVFQVLQLCYFNLKSTRLKDR